MSLVGKKGVDISAANGDVDLAKVKAAGYDFVMIKCGIGNDDVTQDDSQFENNVRKAEALGMPWGAWLYSYALNEQEARSEAAHVIRLLKGKRPTLPVALDMEDADGYHVRNGGWNFHTVNTVCKVFLAEIEKAGFYPMLYTGFEGIDNYISSEIVNKYDIWFAQWNRVCQYDGNNLGMWQYGGEVNYLESNSIPGVGVIDKDRCFKDYPSIIKNGGYNGWKGSEPSESNSAVRIKTDSKLRSEAYCGGNSRIITTVKKGTAVSHLIDDGYGWSKIKADGKTGWVQNTRLTKPGLSSYPKMIPAATVFEKPDVKSKPLGQIVGSSITVRYVIEAGAGRGWAEVAYPNSSGVGFVPAACLY